MHIDIFTIFPDYFAGPFGVSIVARARERGLLDLRPHDLRTWTHDRHRTVDDAPFGGGAGMVMQPGPFYEGVEDLYGSVQARPRTVVFTPRGRVFDQNLAAELATESRLLLLCGRYEGIDERVHQGLATDEVSIGDYVLAGGEAAAAVVVEAVARLLPGVLGNTESSADESHTAGLLEYPQYTRPSDYRGMEVPEVLRSGDHGRVAEWRREQAIAGTKVVRPDLYEKWRSTTTR